MEVPGQTGEDQLQEAEALMAKTLRRITLDFCEELCHMLALRSDPRPLVSRNAESADFTIYWPKDEFAQLRVQHDGKVARVNFGELEEDFDEPTDKPVLFFAVKENPKDWIVIGEEAFVDLKAARQIIAQRFGLEDFEVRRLQPVSGDVGLISSLCDAVDNSVLSDIMPEEDSEDSLEVQKNFLLYMLKVQTILFLLIVRDHLDHQPFQPLEFYRKFPIVLI